MKTEKDNQLRAANRSRGFTLAEILIVVGIVGLTAAISIPNLLKSRLETQITRVVKGLHTFEDAFGLYSVENGAYPADCELEAEDHLPPGSGMAGYLRVSKWKQPTSLGGHYNWEGPDKHGHAAISICGDDVQSNVMRRLDGRLDDGNLATGKFRIVGERYTYVIEENAPSM